jgi:hypothetical protein
MDFRYEIVKFLGVIAERTDNNGNKWTKEVNLVSWNGRDPKIDIREWNADHIRMSKGLTFTESEAESLYMTLHNYLAERNE